MKIVYISFLLFNYVSFMLSHLFNPLSAKHLWKNRIFAVKKLLQTLNYCKIAVVELRIAAKQIPYNSNILPHPICLIKRTVLWYQLFPFFSFSNLKRFFTFLIIFSSSGPRFSIIIYCEKNQLFFEKSKSVVFLKKRFKILVILSNTKILWIMQIIIKSTCSIFVSSNNFFIIFFTYIKMSKDLSIN